MNNNIEDECKQITDMVKLMKINSTSLESNSKYSDNSCNGYIKDETPSPSSDFSEVQYEQNSHTEDKPTGVKRKPSTYIENNSLFCETCLETFESEDKFQVHIQNVHAGSALLPCDVCCRKFARIGTLKMHLRTHTGGARPFSCNLCSRHFSLSKNLQMHLKSHAQEKTFCCPRCPTLFDDSRSLNNHIKLHFEEDAFTCPACKKKLSSNFAMKFHLKTTHGMGGGSQGIGVLTEEPA